MTISGDDLLSSDEAAELLGISVERLESLKWRLPCEISLRDRSVRVRRRDLAAWSEALGLEKIERRQPAVPTVEQVDVMRRMRDAQRQFGQPSEHQ